MNLPANGFLLTRLHFYSLPLPLSEADLNSWRSRFDSRIFSAFTSKVAVLHDAKIRLAVALRTTREMIGVLLLGPPSAGRGVQRCCAIRSSPLCGSARADAGKQPPHQPCRRAGKATPGIWLLLSKYRSVYFPKHIQSLPLATWLRSLFPRVA